MPILMVRTINFVGDNCQGKNEDPGGIKTGNKGNSSRGNDLRIMDFWCMGKRRNQGENPFHGTPERGADHIHGKNSSRGPTNNWVI